MASGKNPLFIHAIVLCILSIALIAGGVGDLISGMSGGSNKMSVTQGLSKARGLKTAGRQGTGVVKSLGSMKKPTTLGGVSSMLSKGNQVKSLGKSALRFVRMGWFLVLGLITAAIAIFVFKQKNWARIAGFGVLAASLLTGCSVLGVWMGTGTSVPLCIVALVLLAPATSKLLWDLMLEEFVPA